ncbi:MAG: hypothetical protein FJ271_02430 [Planctomycetes bacterium]|nr:hypothetical protein [Planctomycetota bacterium]
MNCLTIRNAAILALLQLGAVSATALTAALVFRWHTGYGLTEPLSIRQIADHGWYCLLVPVVWFVVTYQILGRDDSSDRARGLAALSGILLLAVLLLAASYTAWHAWLLVGHHA